MCLLHIEHTVLCSITFKLSNHFQFLFAVKQTKIRVTIFLCFLCIPWFLFLPKAMRALERKSQEKGNQRFASSGVPSFEIAQIRVMLACHLPIGRHGGRQDGCVGVVQEQFSSHPTTPNEQTDPCNGTSCTSPHCSNRSSGSQRNCHC